MLKYIAITSTVIISFAAYAIANTQSTKATLPSNNTPQQNQTSNKTEKGKIEVSDAVKAELKAFRDKKKALYEALSSDAKSALDRRREARKQRAMEHASGATTNNPSKKSAN